MADSYTWVNFSKKISTTQKIYEPSKEAYGYGYFFVTVNSEHGWTGANKDNRAMGVAGQLWRDSTGTTPDNITGLLSFQINQEEEGILITNYGFNVFLPNYTTRIEESLNEMTEITSSLNSCIDEFKNALLNLSNDILISNGGGNITTPTFKTNIQTTNSNLDAIQKNINNINDKINQTKDKL